MSVGDGQEDLRPTSRGEMPAGQATQVGSSPTSPSGPADAQVPGLYLEVIVGDATETTIHVEDEFVIGRYAAGVGQLSQDIEISREHALIAREASGEYAIEDLGSSNGTFVNGLKIAAPQLLAAGDSIEVGAATLVVRSILAPGPPAPAQGEQQPASPEYTATVFARAPSPPQAVPNSQPDARAAPAPASDPEASGGDESPAVSRRPAPPRLKLEVDFEAGELSIAPGEGEDGLRLVFDDGRWQARPGGD